ncbi:hypothetical protein [Hydrogenophaga sp. SL48]|nr:hypothetical protein IM738_00130 [Hydrogenophaga sp. SL48]
MAIKEICRKYDLSDATFYVWRSYSCSHSLACCQNSSL